MDKQFLSRRFFPIIITSFILLISMVFILAWLVYSRGSAVLPVSNYVRGRIIVIDAGHGGEDPGAVGPEGILEKDLNLAVAQKLAAQLQEAGAQVIMTRTEDIDYVAPRAERGNRTRKQSDLDKRLEIVRNSGGEILISLHVNASKYPNRSGAETFYNPSMPASKLLAENIQVELRKIPSMNKKVAKVGNYYLLKQSPIPAVIVEMGFISNPGEFNRLRNPDYQEELARAIASGIDNYFKQAASFGENNRPSSAALTVFPSPNWLKHAPSGNEATVFFPFIWGNEILFLPAGSINTSQDLIGQALTALLCGPSSMPQPVAKEIAQAQPLLEKLPVDSLSYRQKGSLLELQIADALREYLAASSEEEKAFLYTLLLTLFATTDCQEIKLVAADHPEEKTLAGHQDISHTFTRQNLPLIANGKYYREGNKAKLAIVIDDFGQKDTRGTKEMLNLKKPLTFAIMPLLSDSTELAFKASQQGYQVLLHLPLEPLAGKKAWLGPGAIKVDMSDEEIKNTLLADLSSVPTAVGVNNHMGSKATADRRVMRVILSTIKEHNLFFLDSLTSNQSVVTELAQEMKVPYVRRDVFLDNQNNLAAIKKQLRVAGEIALARGSAVAIGHVGVSGLNMFRALQEVIPELEKRGIELVFVSELVSFPQEE